MGGRPEPVKQRHVVSRAEETLVKVGDDNGNVHEANVNKAADPGFTTSPRVLRSHRRLRYAEAKWTHLSPE